MTGLFATMLLAMTAGASAASARAPVLAIHEMAFVVPDRPLTAGETLLVRNDDIFQHSAMAYIDHDWTPNTPDEGFEGDSAETDLRGAIQWVEKAAKAGNSEAQGTLAQLYGIAGPT